eukprot:gene19872-20375_t
MAIKITDKPNSRLATRHKVLTYAMISPDSPKRVNISCILKDMSPTGCQIVGSSVECVDSRFYIKVSADAEIRECRVVWRRKHMIGARFIDADTEAEEPAPEADAAPAGEVLQPQEPPATPEKTVSTSS